MGTHQSEWTFNQSGGMLAHKPPVRSHWCMWLSAHLPRPSLIATEVQYKVEVKRVGVRSSLSEFYFWFSHILAE